MALALVFVLLAQLLVDQGMGDRAPVQRREITPLQVDTAFWVALVATGGLLTVALFLLAWPISELLGEPDLQPILQVLSLTFVLAAFTTIQIALLRRPGLPQPLPARVGRLGGWRRGGRLRGTCGVGRLGAGGPAGRLGRLLGAHPVVGHDVAAVMECLARRVRQPLPVRHPHRGWRRDHLHEPQRRQPAGGRGAGPGRAGVLRGRLSDPDRHPGRSDKYHAQDDLPGLQPAAGRPGAHGAHLQPGHGGRGHRDPARLHCGGHRGAGAYRRSVRRSLAGAERSVAQVCCSSVRWWPSRPSASPC